MRKSPRDSLFFRANDIGISTGLAAIFLKRKPQTLRKWACFGSGPMQPVARINGRLVWSVSEIVALRNKETTSQATSPSR